MSSTMKKWLARGAVVGFAAIAMLLVGPDYMAATTCGQEPERPGFCPPFDNHSCAFWCVTHGYYQYGECVGGEQNGCCTCFI